MRRSLIVLILLSASMASAEPTVLAIEGADIYVDLGARDGVGAGTELELLHEVVAKDPRTGAVLRDRFALGTLAVVKSGDRLSVARAAPELASRVLAGDRVRLVSAPRTFIDPWLARIEASKLEGGLVGGPVGPGAPSVDHVGLARTAWQATLGQPPERRIEIWRELLAADPRSPYRKVIENESRASPASSGIARPRSRPRAASAPTIGTRGSRGSRRSSRGRPRFPGPGCSRSRRSSARSRAGRSS